MRFLFFILLLISKFSFAYIPSSAFIVQNVAGNHGKPPYQIEQEVRLTNSSGELVFKEIWIVESDTSQKLIVTGSGDMKDKLFVTFSYSAGLRSANGTSTPQTKSTTSEFFEDMFWTVQSDRLAKRLIRQGFAPNIVPHKYVKGKSYSNEEFLKLSRVGGVITYQFAQKANPALWIEQDAFTIRKIRFSENVEVSAENYNSYPRGLKYPQNKRLSWGPTEANIQTTNVAAKSSADIQSLLKKPPMMMGLMNHPLKATFEEFFQRFR